MSARAEQINLPGSAANQRPSMLQMPAPAPTVNLENVEDFSKVCRVCAAITELVMPIYSGEGQRNNLADKINRHLPITVSSTDALPQVICYQCASTLLAAHELAQCSLQADAALRTRAAARARSVEERQQASRAAARREQARAKAEENASAPADVGFIAVVRRVLVDYYHTLNMDEDDDCQFACQKCSWRADTVEALAAHLRDHRALAAAAVARFVREHVTFEQALHDEPEPEPRAPPASEPSLELPAHCCPFCETVFSSTTRLGVHLAEHVEIGADSAVECCGVVFGDRGAFLEHAAGSHARAPPPGAVCRACGHRAAGAAGLRDHIRAAHADAAVARRRRTAAQRAAPTADQKYIPVECPDCGRTFSNKYNMAVHARGHRGERPEPAACDRCPRRYSSRGALVSHWRAAHAGELRFACEACGERFQTRSLRARHAALHTGERRHACTQPGCASAFRSRNSLLRHLDAHRDVRAYKCPCGKAFRRSSHLAYHRKTHRVPVAPNASTDPVPDDTYRRCGFCPQVVAGAEYEAHLLALHTALLFHCDECNNYIARKNFLAHMTAHAADYEELRRPEPRAAAAPTCAPADSTTRPADTDGVIDVSSTTTEDVAERDDDFSDQSDAEPFVPLPDAVLNVMEDSQEAPPAPEPDAAPPAAEPMSILEPQVILEAHEPDAAPPAAEPRVILAAPGPPTADPEPPPARKARPVRQCPHCPKKYTAASSYFYHLKYFHGRSREHPCATCGRAFGTRGALREHETLHEPGAGLQCDTCGKRFRSKAGHYIHTQTHTDERKFSCDECGRAFRWLAALRRHSARHGARRGHRCGSCDKAFSVRADMLRHARTHSRAALRCPRAGCGATFAQQRYLRAHVARKHKAAPPEPGTRESA